MDFSAEHLHIGPKLTENLNVCVAGRLTIWQLKIMALIRNVSQCQSLPIYADQCILLDLALKGIDRH